MDETPRTPSRFVGAALFAASCLACALFAAGIVHRPVDDLVGFVSDDAFYYLGTARNLAATGRPTFDGIHPTNGYHPGWMAVSTLIAAFTSDRVMLLRWALAASFALHFAAAYLVARLGLRFLPAFWAFVVGALWAVNPLPVTLAMQGVEAPLHVLALVTVLIAFVRLLESGAGRVPTRRLVELGAALALLFWARTDGAVVAAVTLALVAARSGRRAAPRAVLVAGGVLAAAAIPWFVWSYATTGSLVQDSAAIKALWTERAGSKHGLRIGPAWEFVSGRWLGVPASLLTATPQVAGPLAAALFAALVGGSVVRARRRGEDAPLVAATAWLLVSTAVLGLVYGAFASDQMVWYFGLPGLALFLLAVLWTARLLGRIAALRRTALQSGAGAALVVAAIFLFSRYRDRMPYEYPWQRDVLASQREFEKSVPADARIGCFNAGIPAYFGGRTVVNLDGLVNHDLVEVYRRGELAQWLAGAGIGFVADEPLALGRAQRLTKDAILLTPVASAPLRGWMSPTRFLWRVETR